MFKKKKKKKKKRNDKTPQNPYRKTRTLRFFSFPMKTSL